MIDSAKGPARKPNAGAAPSSPRPGEPEFVSVFRVRSYELDALGHVNHAVYLNYLEQARFEALEAAGIPFQRLVKEGWGIHVVRMEVEYRAECRMGDELHVLTRAEELRNSSMTITQTLVKVDGTMDSEAGESPSKAVPAVQARVVAVWIGPGGRPTRIPEFVRQALSRPEPDPDGSDPPLT